MFLLDEEPTYQNIIDTVNQINVLLPNILSSYTVSRVKQMCWKIPKVWYNHSKNKQDGKYRLIIGVSSRLREDESLYPEIIMGLMDVYRFVNSFIIFG